MRVQSEVDREMWMQRIRLAMDADTLPNYSVSAPSATEAASKSAVLGGAAPAAGGGGGCRREIIGQTHALQHLDRCDRLRPAQGAHRCIRAPPPGKRASCRSCVEVVACRDSVGCWNWANWQVVGKGAFGKVFLVKKRDGDKADQLFAMKVLDKQVITEKGQVAHTKVRPGSGLAAPSRIS